LLPHLEELVDRVGGERVERHGRSGQLERARRQRVHVGDARVGTERGGGGGPAGGGQGLGLWRAGRGAPPGGGGEGRRRRSTAGRRCRAVARSHRATCWPPWR